MKQKEQRNKPRVEAAAGGGDADGTLAALREQSAQLLDAADSAIDRTLSRNSAEFLRANTQQGGQ